MSNLKTAAEVGWRETTFAVLDHSIKSISGEYIAVGIDRDADRRVEAILTRVGAGTPSANVAEVISCGTVAKYMIGSSVSRRIVGLIKLQHPVQVKIRNIQVAQTIGSNAHGSAKDAAAYVEHSIGVILVAIE